MVKPRLSYDVIVIGGGHAGIEAAYAAARLGSSTLMVTLSREKIGEMPCNPAIGGIGKGHIVFEVSALGGLMPQIATQAYLQVRMLNTRKGPAVQGLRLQIDKYVYRALCSQRICSTPNLTVAEEKVKTVLVNNGEVQGVVTASGTAYYAPTVVVTTGTFLKGLMHVGDRKTVGGRHNEQASETLSDFLRSIGLEMTRLKTGTPPRLRTDSVNVDVLEYQGSDDLEYLFEFAPHKAQHRVGCYITHTNKETHAVIQEHAHLSPIFSGAISGTAPRYCPSIEDKVVRFSEKSSHHVFVEPQGLESNTFYPNGISTSLPAAIQERFVRTIRGFEHAVIVRPGYAVEYDAVLPHQLSPALEVNAVSGLFLAGQINGTTGYEEAAGQGIIAGINAHLKVRGEKPFMLERYESYIGVMIDDLTRMGVDEPYRMFTSRAEYRLLLRQDNVFYRLADKAHGIGLLPDAQYTQILQEQAQIDTIYAQLRKGNGTAEIARLLSSGEGNVVMERIKQAAGNVPYRVMQTIYAMLLYGPYIERQEKEIKKFKQYQQLSLPAKIAYSEVPGLSVELQQKLAVARPRTIAHASLIQGMTPAAISLLIFHARRHT